MIFIQPKREPRRQPSNIPYVLSEDNLIIEPRVGYSSLSKAKQRGGSIIQSGMDNSSQTNLFESSYSPWAWSWLRRQRRSCLPSLLYQGNSSCKLTGMIYGYGQKDMDGAKTQIVKPSAFLSWLRKGSGRRWVRRARNFCHVIISSNAIFMESRFRYWSASPVSPRIIPARLKLGSPQS